MAGVDPSATNGAIDAHSHIVTPDVLALLERDGAHYATRIIERQGERQFLIGELATRPINDKILGTDKGAARIHDMDAEGIARELVSCVPFVMYPGVDARRGLAVAQTHNDSVVTFAASRSDRFVGMACVPLQDPALAARELERAHGLGLRSVMIPPNVQDHALDEPLFAPFWEAAHALDMLVFIHPFDATPSGLLARYNLGNLAGNLIETALAATALICGGVLERHPRLRVLLAHAGGTLPTMLGRLDNGYSRSAEMRATIPRPPSTYVNQLWFDTIAFNPPFLRSLVGLLGSDRFVTGSDYPVGGPPHPVAEVRRLELEPADEAAVLRLNALRLLEGPKRLSD
jgi:aminocarboxymuconate-semialdehyde decarboxylase